MKRKLFDGATLRFLIVGMVNTLAGASTMFLLYNLVHCSYWVSSAANYVVGGIVSFFLNKYFTFRRKEWEWKQVVKFVVSISICYLIAYGLAKPIALFLLSGYSVPMRENVSMILGMGLYTCLNYIAQRYFAFQ